VFGKHCTKELVIIISYEFLSQTIHCTSFRFLLHVVHCFTTGAGILNFLRDLEDKPVITFWPRKKDGQNTDTKKGIRINI
jgi:hypothetical protein